jgi:uncharacterized repeat protein (TIGR01451 family)
VKPGDVIGYTIYFENDPEFATAPAQEVFVTDHLSPALDWSTFELTEVVWGDHSMTIAPGTANASFKEVVGDWRPEENKGWWVEGSIGVDAGGTLLASFRTLDPDTEDLPLDPFAGFLPVNDDTGRGEGHISFTIRVREDASTPQLLENCASIVFDTNAPLVTDTVWNTIDDINRPPSLINPGNQENAEGDWARLPLVGRDPDDNPLTYSATGLPAGLYVHPDTGIIAGTIAFDGVDHYEVTAAVTDGVHTATQTFVWAAKPELVSVPDVVGLTQANAQAELLAAGLVVGTVTQAYSETVAQGCVISQNPSAGTLVALGAPVDVVASLGRQYQVADISHDGRIDASDVQLVINAALGRPVAWPCDVNGDGRVNATDVQSVINAALGLR